MIIIKEGATPATVLVTFQVPASIWAESIHLVGDFNGWNTLSHPLSPAAGDGPWQITLELEQGRLYQYRYLVDGVCWKTDWNGSQRMPNPFGSDNAVLET
jgi:1,4-alpha-glucan branching enzyme